MSSPQDEPEYDPSAIPADDAAGYEATYAADGELQETYDPNAYDPNAYEPATYDAAGEAGYAESEIGYAESEVGHASDSETEAPPSIAYTPHPPQEADPNVGVYDDAPADSAPVPHGRRSVPPRRGAAKTRQPAARKPAARPVARSGTRAPYKRPTYAYKEGISMMSVFLGLLTVAMLGLVAMVMWPRELSDIGGYVIDPIAAASNPVKRNLLDEAQKLMVGRSAEMALSETEVNAYLADRFVGDQGGLMGSLVSFKRVLVDFSPGTAEVIVLRELFGFPLTMSCTARIDEVRGAFVFRPTGWTIGHINLDSTNIKPVIDLFGRLKSSASEEFETMRNLTGVRFEDDVIVLDAAI